MNKVHPGIAIGLVVVALGLMGFMIFRHVSTGAGSAANMASLTPKPRENSPTFTTGPNEIVMPGRTPAEAGAGPKTMAHTVGATAGDSR